MTTAVTFKPCFCTAPIAGPAARTTDAVAARRRAGKATLKINLFIASAPWSGSRRVHTTWALFGTVQNPTLPDGAYSAGFRVHSSGARAGSRLRSNPEATPKGSVRARATAPG